MRKKPAAGFTLIEVLIALSIIAIALTALLKALAQNVDNFHRVKQKTISHWVAMQGVTMVQLGLLQILPNQETTQDTKMLGEHWFWRIKATATEQKSVELLTVYVSSEKSGPFREELHAFRYVS